jgi:tetratricopeptide (TPR) repeat protein
MVKEVKGLLEKGKPDEAVKIAREALRVDPVNLEIYDLLKSIREGFGNKELEDLRKRLVTQISRYQKALEAIDSRKEELGDIEKEIEVIKGELYQLEGRLDEFGIKEGEEDPRLSRILDLIRKTKEADETPYEDSSFKELLKSDFFPDLLRYAVSKVRIGEDHDVMRNSLSTLYEIIKEEFDPMRCKDYSAVKSYFYKALPNRLLDKTLHEEYGISPSDCARLRRKWKAESELEQELGRPPKDSEVCERLKCKDDWLNDVKSIEAILSRDFSVDELKDII